MNLVFGIYDDYIISVNNKIQDINEKINLKLGK